MLKASLPNPESKNKSTISFNLARSLFKKYSLSPLRYKRRVTTTSSASICKSFLALSKCSFTSAKFCALRCSAPEKIISSILEPRKDLADCSPNTHLIASVILLLPLPFGPTIAVTPLSNCTFVCSANDLKPMASIDFK